MYLGINFTMSYHSAKSPELGFDEFYSKHKYIDPEWLTWFIGFSEGDGGFHVYNGSFTFGITQSEESILQEIKSVLGFGKVYFDSSANCYRYRVTNKAEIYILAVLFNGRLATKNKIEQLRKWIECLNKNFEVIIHNPNPFVPTLYDAWLSGFTDAEGCFYVSIVKQKVKIAALGHVGGIMDKIFSRVRIRFNIDQKEEFILLHIKTLFGVGSVNTTSDPGVFKYSNGSFKGNSVTVDYFKSFPLKTKKLIAFQK
jgi:hypothetical protein